MAAKNLSKFDIENYYDEIYTDFCEKFQFSSSSTCWVCCGFYGPSFGEPLCGCCHSFIFPQADEVENFVTKFSDDSDDSGNEDDKNQQEESDDSDLELERPRPQPPRNLEHYLDLLSRPQERREGNSNNQGEPKIKSLPVEVLLQIFSYLDDLSMWSVSEVCKQWRDILQENTHQAMWKKYTRERFPLYQQISTIPNWFHMYSALMSSCFCRSCLIQMATKTPLRREDFNLFRASRLRGDIRSISMDSSEGIDAMPLDNQQSHWQASILGPSNSPYEGGKFFLYIVIPNNYPMSPPQVRFLTKIIHPNVSRHGDVGIDIIQHNWSLALTISKLLLSVQSLLTDPFTDICMESELGQLYESERPKFEALARYWTYKFAMFEILPPL